MWIYLYVFVLLYDIYLLSLQSKTNKYKDYEKANKHFYFKRVGKW